MTTPPSESTAGSSSTPLDLRDLPPYPHFYVPVLPRPPLKSLVLAVALFSKALFHVAPLRATTSVAQTLIRAWEAAGFLPIQRFTGSDGGDYLQLAMPPSNLG